MTTAHRPTFDPAKGRDHSNKASIKHARELKSHSKLKFRKSAKRKHEDFESDEEEGVEIKRKVLDDEKGSEGVEELKEDLKELSQQSAEESEESDVEEQESDASESEESESGSESDGDDEEELMREFAKIKAERAAEKEKQEKEQAIEKAMQSNPLMASQKPKKSWRRETVFAKQQAPTKTSESYSNDSLRSESHKKFMDKFIR